MKIRSLPYQFHHRWKLASATMLVCFLLGCESALTRPSTPTPPMPATSVRSASLTATRVLTPSPDAGASYGGSIDLRFDSLPQQRHRAPDPSTPPSDRVYQLTPGEALQGELGMRQTYPDAKVLRLMGRLHYGAVAFRLDDREMPTSFDIELSPGQERYFRLATPPLATGYYDFALVVVVDPNNTALDGRSRFRTKSTPVLRRSVYVGPAVPPTVPFPPLPAITTGKNVSDLLFLTEQPEELDLWPGRSAAPGEVLRLFVHTAPLSGNVRPGAPPGDGVPVALVAFMDDHAVPIGTDAVVYALTRPGEIGTLPITVTVPTSPGPHQYFVHQFPNPYVDTVLANAGDHSFYSQSTQRIVLDVRQP